MNINIHTIDLDIIERRYKRRTSKFLEFLNINKSSKIELNSKGLQNIYNSTKQYIEWGNALNHPKQTILPYMQLCLEAIVGYYRVCSNTGKEVSFTLDGETIKAVANESPVEHRTDLWSNGVLLSIITRNNMVKTELLKYPINKYYHEQDINIEFMNIYKHLLTNELDKVSILTKKLVSLLNSDEDFIQEFWDYLTIPKLEVIKPLIENNETLFQEKLYIANQKHKEYWGSQAEEPPGSGFKRAQDNMGFISLPLTALAALAHDRGWTIDFESDYMPNWMVRGEFDK